ncbi:MAG: glycosyltransferase family 4 protein [Planctomycetota bacterium]|jgi:glycosyltransferase involved in cell wall biosynthesis
MKVVALTRTGSRGPSTRYRIEQYRSALADRGITVETRPLFGDTWFRILELRIRPVRALAKTVYSLARLVARAGQALEARRGDADLVLVEQQFFPYLPWFIERLLWPVGKRVILEFDDAIYLTFGHAGKLSRLCARADLVITGNETLAGFARQHAREVAVIPTTVDVARYAQPAREPDGTLRVGWIGLRYNLPYLRELAGPLRQLAARGIDCELRVISSGPPAPGPEWAGVRIVHRPWSEAHEAEEIAACDVGVMPLPDVPWARGKCGLKLLQFMAAGRPVVASPVGVNRALVRPEETGLLAEDAAGWERAFSRLHEDAQLAQRLGAAGRRLVEAEYSLARGARLVAETYVRALSAPGTP